MHSAAIHLLRRVRKQDVATGEGPARLSALSVLVFGGPKTLGELAAAEQVKPPTMSRIVAGLAKSRLIDVAVDPADARRMQIRATAKGKTILQKGRERRIAYHVTEIGNDQVHYSNGSVSDLFGNSTRIVRGGGRVDEFNPSNQFYLFPLRPGATWDMKVLQTSGERKFDLEVNLKVIGEEEVETPAGRMRGLRIERVARWKERDSPVAGVNTWTYWYNSGVKRIVAGEQKNVTASGKVLLHERYDLAAYQVR